MMRQRENIYQTSQENDKKDIKVSKNDANDNTSGWADKISNEVKRALNMHLQKIKRIKYTAKPKRASRLL